MAMTDGDVQIATSMQGGFMKGLKRTLGGESFFVNDFSSATGGTVGVAAALPGDMSMVSLDGSTGLLVQSGSWIASDASVTVDSKWGGGKTFFSGEGLILLKCTGQGDLLLSAYGAILACRRPPGRSSPWTRATSSPSTRPSSTACARPAAGSRPSSAERAWSPTSRVRGRVWLQTRSSMDLISWIQSKLPPQRS